MPFVNLFEESKGLDRFALGGKGFGLVAMTAIGLPVPPGFVITTEACKSFYSAGGRLPDGLMEEVMKALKVVEGKTGRRFGDPAAPLLVSVRSGAPFSMPGMMDTILNLGLNDSTADGLSRLSGSERLAYDAYRRFLQLFGKVAMKVPGERFEEVIQSHKDRLGVKKDLDLSAAELRDIVGEFKEIIKKSTGGECPTDPVVQLKMAIEAVFRSWNNPRAKEYRAYYKISDDLGTAVNIQAMVFGNLGQDSGSGVGFTRNPSTGEKRLYGEYLTNAQGEDVVAGIRTPESLDALEPRIGRELAGMAQRLEAHFRDMQDFEFTVEGGKLYLLQTRNGKRTTQAAIKIAVDMVKEGLISKEEALLRVDPAELGQVLHRRLDPRAKPKAIAKGLNASPGAASGSVVFDTDEAVALGAKGEAIILVRPETTPDDIKGLVASRGVLTLRGGMTSHAAVVARGMGKPAVAGCSELELFAGAGYFRTPAGVVVKKGDVITIDGSAGTVMLGEVPTVEPELSGDFKELMSWAESVKRLGVRANADTPESAKKAREFGAEGIGLCRTERMFNLGNRLPIVQEMVLGAGQQEFTSALDRLFPFQLDDFREIFSVMKGTPVVVRLLDLPLHEFLPSAEEALADLDGLKAAEAPQAAIDQKAKTLARIRQLSEHNPMIGYRGCRVGMLHPELYRMQTRAILKGALDVLEEEGETVEVYIMLPLISEAREMEVLRKVIDEEAEDVFRTEGRRIEYRVGTMVETPRAALTAGEIAKYADFFSFGTNDLTQTTFAFSRDDVEATFLPKYLEMKVFSDSPFEVLDTAGVGRLVRMGVEGGRTTKPSFEVGICGEHGGEPQSVKFFHAAGLDYVSCSPYRIPVAKLAAAQAALERDKASSTV
jgi:pyruvate,orthophosphate dikinase